ncbi:MAG TPA: hypothetical protein VNO69_02045, partial [Methyloceanibacter sp.]|nr:hypothetical protein [Methyloceanibacter sp.]
RSAELALHGRLHQQNRRKSAKGHAIASFLSKKAALSNCIDPNGGDKPGLMQSVPPSLDEDRCDGSRCA